MIIVDSKLDETLVYIDNKIEEFASNILGHQETAAYDIVYEEFIDSLNVIKNKLEVILEITSSDE